MLRKVTFGTLSIAKSVGGRSLATAVFPGAYLERDEVTKRVFYVAKEVKFCPEHIEESHAIKADLKFDALLRKDFAEKLEKEFCVKMPPEVKDNLLTLRSVIDYFAAHPKVR